MNIHEQLLDELDSFDPEWRSKYKGVLVAAQAANCTGLFWQWIDTPEGLRYSTAQAGVEDWTEHVRRSKAQVTASRNMVEK